MSDFSNILLLATPHCLNAVVLKYHERARKLFEERPEVQRRSPTL